MTFSPKKKSIDTSSNVFMVFGKTGNGKSTLIKLFCGDNAPSSIIGHGTESKTKDTSFFTELDKNNKLKRMWIDTMGTSDSSDNMSNEDILRKVMAKMHDTYPNGFNVKVVWVVKPESRATSDLKIEAAFINSLAKYSSSNIWDSTIIIIRGGQLKSKSKGALAAAAEYYTNVTVDKKDRKFANIDSIGYTMLSALDEDNDIRQKVEDDDIDETARLTFGYLYDEEIMKKVSVLLNSKNFIKITFKKDKCVKCGIIGDARFVPTKCHQRFERKHGISLDENDSDDEYKIDYIHTGKKEWRHKEGETLLKKHTKHIGQIRHKSNNTYEKYCGQEVSGYTKKRVCKNGYSHDLRAWSTGSHRCFSCRRKLDASGWFIYCCYDCSEKNFCLSCTREVDGKPTFRCIYRTTHSCCHQPYESDNFCKSEWLCCNEDVSDPGCIEVWSNCGKDKDNKGCEEYWTCCNEPVKGGKPCKYSCCKQDRDSIGCRKICKQCQKPYGKGPGCCTENVKHKYKKN